MIDGDCQSLGSHGKDRFVYSALSPGSAWQLDLYCSGWHRKPSRLGSLALSQVRFHSALKQPMHFNAVGERREKIGSTSDRLSDPETRAKGKKGEAGGEIGGFVGGVRCGMSSGSFSSWPLHSCLSLRLLIACSHINTVCRPYAVQEISFLWMSFFSQWW